MVSPRRFYIASYIAPSRFVMLVVVLDRVGVCLAGRLLRCVLSVFTTSFNVQDVQYRHPRSRSLASQRNSRQLSRNHRDVRIPG
jgi:hypothetical protein